jgi:hypothetical protein
MPTPSKQPGLSLNLFLEQGVIPSFGRDGRSVSSIRKNPITIKQKTRM